jgi:flagellar motor switch/type III secretory pathway protein FliN
MFSAEEVSFRLLSSDSEEWCNAFCENVLGVPGRQQVWVLARCYGHKISLFGRNDDGSRNGDGSELTVEVELTVGGELIMGVEMTVGVEIMVGRIDIGDFFTVQIQRILPRC